MNSDTPAVSDINLNALIIEGGAMRSVFSAGLLDGFLAEHFNPFDLYIGVSAGAYNLATYMAGRSGLSLRIFLELATSKNFINYSRFILGGHLLDLDWLFATAMAESHFAPEQVYAQGKPLYVCVTDVNSGKAVYVDTNPDNLEQAIKASTALPLLYRGFPLVEQRPMTDGGVADGIPVAEAIRLGAQQIMVIRSRPESYIKKDTLGHKFIRWKLRKNALLIKTMNERVKRFDDAIQLIRNPPPAIKIVEICPPENFTIGRFNRSREYLQQGYAAGICQARQAIQEWTSRCQTTA